MFLVISKESIAQPRAGDRDIDACYEIVTKSIE